MASKKTAVLVPCFNEETALPELLAELLSKFSAKTIVVINDGSTDSTPKIASAHGVKLINLPVNMGIGVAMQTGYRYALRNGFDYAVQCDGDGQHRADEIILLKKAMEATGADMVVGSRFVDKNVAGFKSYIARRAVIRYLSLIINAVTGMKIYDVTSGFRMANKKVIEIFAENYPFDYPEPEALVLLKNYRLKIAETPVSMRERIGGVSSIGFLNGVYYIVKVTIGLAVTRLRGTN